MKYLPNFEFPEFIEKLRYRLSCKLPGKKAQLLMASSSRILNYGIFPRLSKKSSVLILLFPDNVSIKLVFIRRPEYIGVHSGQISLPGGKNEKFDKDFLSTALRETYEEVGVEPEKIKIIGQLTELYIPPSNFLVYPFVGFTLDKPVFKADTNEVSEIIQLNIFDFLDEKNVILSDEIKVRYGINMKIPYYRIDEHIIWGATAMIMSEFIQIIKSINK